MIAIPKRREPERFEVFPAIPMFFPGKILIGAESESDVPHECFDSFD